jgi:hypothetical protein
MIIFDYELLDCHFTVEYKPYYPYPLYEASFFED